MTTKERISAPPMMSWQYRNMLAQLGQISLHASDDSCPCNQVHMGDDGKHHAEYCLGKHLIDFWSLAQETALMDAPRRDMLDSMASEALEFHEKAKIIYCKGGTWPDLAQWSRDVRKKLEPIYYACNVKPKAAAHLHADMPVFPVCTASLHAPPAAAPAVKITGNCHNKACDFKVTATKKTEGHAATCKALPATIEDVMSKALAGTGKPEPKVSDKTFAMGITTSTRYEFQFKVVDADDLIVSNDPFTFEKNTKYQKTLQPRDRGRAATQLQVESIAANLTPDLLLLDFLSIDKGSPIVGPDNLVECGNGRVMGIIRASRDNKGRYEAYRQHLKQVAPAYGLDVAAIDKMKTPVLVRVRLTDVNRKAFAEECNARTTIQSSAIENAKTDAEKITTEMLGGLDVLEGETIEAAIRATRNKPFVVSFLSKLPANEQAGLVDSKGVLSQEGVRRTVMAIFVATFHGDVGLAIGEKFFEATDPDVKTVFAGILRSLAMMARAESLTQSGAREKDYAFAEDLAKVVVVYSRIKSIDGYTVGKYLAQLALETRELDSFQERILQVIDQNARSGKRIGQILTNYAQAVIDSPPPSQSGFFPGAKVTKLQLFENAVRKALTVPEFASMSAETCDLPSPRYRNMALFFEAGLDSIAIMGAMDAPERKIDQVLAQLQKGVENLQNSNEFRKFMDTMAKFHNYSLGNIILIMLQKPNASKVAGFNTWKSMGRYVKMGERGISILAPCFPAKPKKEILEPQNKETTEKQEVEDEFEIQQQPMYFRVVSVFDISQTDGKEIPTLDVPVLTGDQTGKLYNRVVQVAAGLHITLIAKSEMDVNPATMGYWNRSTQSIWIRDNVAKDQQTKTLLHELAHAVADMKNATDAETMAEGVAYTVAQHFGFDTGVRSFPYVAGWSGDIKVLKSNLDMIRKVSTELIGKIEAAGQFECANLHDLTGTLVKKLDKCNLDPGESSKALSWKPLRDFISWAIGKGKVSLCSVGMVPGVYQLTVSGLKDIAEAASKAKIPGAKRVWTLTNDLVYEIVVPEEGGKELEWKAQEIFKMPAKREPSAQAAMFAVKEGKAGVCQSLNAALKDEIHAGDDYRALAFAAKSEGMKDVSHTLNAIAHVEDTHHAKIEGLVAKNCGATSAHLHDPLLAQIATQICSTGACLAAPKFPVCRGTTSLKCHARV